MKRILVTSLIILFCSLVSFAQNSTGVDMADELRSSGKIYVVVAVMSVIFIGIIIYLFSIDKRIKKIENSKNV
ncbi:MAG: CcmD family protein [Daejeonella sp.]